uniref:Uncharacterized protein n=1 Tax=Anopheles maculatus TaxID=74869 RepID=A0A182TAS7_9DIPT
ILAAKELVLWIALGSFIGTIAIEENVGATSLVESKNLTTTSTTTTAAPTTSTTSTTPSTTFSSTSPTTSSKATTSSSPSTPSILARANPITSSSTIRSIISTTTSATTTKPSAKRQISLNEFQQLVAKVNDEISMLRNQSANLSQTYEELVRRYNDRTSQVPIVLYDVSDCSNSTTVQEETSTEALKQTSIVSEVTKPTTSSERTTSKTTTVITSTTQPPSSSSRVEHSTQKESLSDESAPVVAAPQNTGSSNTQIYGNKYYNYIHYFMYPPSEEQLEEIGSAPQVNHRRKSGNDSRKATPTKRRKEVPYQTNKRWEERTDSREEPLEPEYSVNLRRWPQEPIGEISNSRRPVSSDYRPFLGSPVPAIGGQYRFGGAAQRKPIEPQSSSLPALPKLAPLPYVEERIPPRVVPEEKIFASIADRKKPSQPETAPKAPVYQTDNVPSFLDRRNVYRSGLPTTQRTTKAPGRLFTPSTTVTREPVTPPSIESLFSFGAKPVSYSIPTTVKPSPGIARNGWDGYDFSFVRKAQEMKKRLQREQRSSRKGVPEL